MVKYIVTMQLM